jgi:hypothetical protein
LNNKKDDCGGDIEYGAKLTEGINVIKQIILQKIKDQETAAIAAAAEAKAKGHPLPEEKVPVVPGPTEDEIKGKINILKKLQHFLENKDQECKGENEYGAKLSEAISVIDEILIEKIKDKEAEGEKLAKENAAAEDKAENANNGARKGPRNRFAYDPMRDIEVGGTKRRRSSTKRKSTTRKRSSTKRSRSTR